MLARHLPPLWVFAGGCLSGATLIVFFRGEPETPSPPKEQRTLEQTTEPSAPPTTAKAVVPDDALADEVAVAEPRSPKSNDDSDSDSPAEAGSSVADLLMHLEAAYRKGLAATAPANAPDTAAPAAREEPAVPVAVAVAAPVPVPAPAPATQPLSAPPAPAPPADQAEAVASRDAAPREVHIGDVNQNTTTIGSLHQGDVYLLQQLAYMQYFQPFPVSPEVRAAAPMHAARGASPSQFPKSVTTRGAPTFSFPIINPDNPWGFDFPPPPLVK